MFRSLFLFRRLLATTFLVVFVNVFVGQCWCATMNAAPRQPVARQLAPPKLPHAGCQGHSKATAKPEASSGHKHHSSGKTTGSHECCRDKTASLLASLTMPAEKQLLTPAPALLPSPHNFYFRPAADAWDYTQAVTLVPQEHLPPKIPDIRIFIQSLTV